MKTQLLSPLLSPFSSVFSGSHLQLAVIDTPTDPYMLWGCALAGIVALFLLFYVPIRSLQQPRKGLLYVLWLLVAGPIYIANPANKGGTLGTVLMLSFCALFILDRIVTRGPLARPRGALSDGESRPGRGRGKNTGGLPSWDRWVLGWAYNRTWNPERGEYRLTRAKGKERGDVDTVYNLSMDQVRTSVLIVAPPGSGKTSSFLTPMLRWLKRIEATAIYLDAKGNDFSPSQFDYNFDLAGSHGAHSLPLYVWSGDNLEQAAERLAEALIPSGDEETQYFSDNAKITLRVLSRAYHMATERRPTLQQLLNLLDTGGEDWADLLQTLERVAPGSQVLKDLGRVEQLARMKSDPLGKLYNALSPLCTGRAGALMSADPDGAIDIEGLLRQPNVTVRFGLPHGLYPAATASIARLVLAQFRYAVISPTSNTGHLKVMACDEAHLFVTPDIAKGIAMTRSNNGAYVLALQSLSQIENPSVRETVVASAGVKVVMSGVADTDAEKFSRLWGRMEHQYVSHSTGTSRGLVHGSGTNTASNTSWAAAGTGAGGGGGGGVSRGRGSSSGMSYNSTETSNTSYSIRPVWLEREIREVGQWHCIVEARDYMGGMSPVTVVDLDRSLTDVMPVVQERKHLLETGVWEPVWEPVWQASDTISATSTQNRRITKASANGTQRTTSPNGSKPQARRIPSSRLASLEELGSRYSVALQWHADLKSKRRSPLNLPGGMRHRRERKKARAYLQQLRSDLQILDVTPRHVWTISRVRHDLARLKEELASQSQAPHTSSASHALQEPHNTESIEVAAHPQVVWLRALLAHLLEPDNKELAERAKQAAVIARVAALRENPQDDLLWARRYTPPSSLLGEDDRDEDTVLRTMQTYADVYDYYDITAHLQVAEERAERYVERSEEGGGGGEAEEQALVAGSEGGNGHVLHSAEVIPSNRVHVAPVEETMEPTEQSRLSAPTSGASPKTTKHYGPRRTDTASSKSGKSNNSAGPVQGEIT